jgi:hypothetical protein
MLAKFYLVSIKHLRRNSSKILIIRGHINLEAIIIGGTVELQ